MKKIVLLLFCFIIAIGLTAQDRKIEIKSATASSYQPGEDIVKAIDGKTGTIWHTSWNATSFPVTYTLTLTEATHIDYLRYIPRQDGGSNGNWNDVAVSYCTTTTGTTFTEIGNYKLNGSGNAYDFIMPEGGIDCGKVRFTISSGKNGFASAAEIEAYVYDNSKQEAFSKYFSDNLFTTLKPEVTSSEGIEDEDVKKLVENLLTNAENYKKFRIGEYEAYLTTTTLRNRLKTSSQYNNYENPTGIYLKSGESCIAVVSGISKYTVGLKIKNWVKNEQSSSYPLRNGMNFITATTEGNLFVDYYTDEFEQAPNVKIHFINAPVQGYWDQATMTNDDWVQLLKGRTTKDSTILITRSEHAQLAFPVFAWLQNCPNNIDSTMTLYQQVQWAERDILGLEKYGKQVKNRQLFYATTYGFMAAGSEGAYCATNSLGGITKPDASNFDFWGVGHEWGHNNQITPGFKWTGCGETTNNIYAAWAQLLFTGNPHSVRLENEITGIDEYSGTRGGRMQTYFEEALRKGCPWQLQDGPDYHGESPTTVTVNGQDANGKNIGSVTTTWRHYDHFVKLVPFWQLLLWGTHAEKCPDIIPMVIEGIRTDENYGNTHNTNGKQQINWIKLACDSAKIDLLPFFEKAGMLRPINAYIDDYAKGWNIITEEMIDTLKAHVKRQGYPAFTEEINYINAHNCHIYRNNLKLQTPQTMGEGCTYNNGRVTVQHSIVKNAVAFETYNSKDELIRITMYGLAADDAHSYTQVLYPAIKDSTQTSAYIMAVGYDGTRTKIYEKTNILKELSAGKYYRIISSGKGNALSCGANTSISATGSISWSLARATKSSTKADQVWMWEERDGNMYLYNPQSDCYFDGTANTKTSELAKKEKAPAWESQCIDDEKNLYLFKIKDSGNYLNSYSESNTGLWTGGASDANNIWKVEEATSISVTIPANCFVAACYPFAVTLPEGINAYTVSRQATINYEGSDYDYAILEEITEETIPACAPVIYSGEAGTYSLTIVNDESATIANVNLLKGTTLKRSIDKGTFLGSLTSVNVAGTTACIKSLSTSTQIQANKSYLLKEDVNNAELLYLAIKGVHTGIDNVKHKNNVRLYDLKGNIVDKPECGHIYVTSDGKKVLIKR